MKFLFPFLFFVIALSKAQPGKGQSVLNDDPLQTDTLSGKLNTIYSKEYKIRAETLQKLVQDAETFYHAKFPHLKFDAELWVLDHQDWKKTGIPLPYGVPVSLSQQNRLMVAAEKNAVAALVGIEDTSPDDILSDYDYIALHELGHNFFHVVNKIQIPEKWADEFLATYFATCYLKEVNSDKMLPRADFPNYQPKHKSLEDFETLYFGVGPQNYGWYQDKFQDLSIRLYPKHHLKIIELFIQNFSEKGEKISSLSLLKKIDEKIINQWLTEMQ